MRYLGCGVSTTMAPLIGIFHEAGPVHSCDTSRASEAVSIASIEEDVGADVGTHAHRGTMAKEAAQFNVADGQLCGIICLPVDLATSNGQVVDSGKADLDYTGISIDNSVGSVRVEVVADILLRECGHAGAARSNRWTADVLPSVPVLILVHERLPCAVRLWC